MVAQVVVDRHGMRELIEDSVRGRAEPVDSLLP